MEAEAIKKVMDDLFGSKVTFHEALEQLSVSEDELHKMIDGYEYTPTTEDILENNRMILEELEYIEKEIAVNYSRNTQQHIRPASAVGDFGNTSEIATLTDAINVKPNALDIPSANGSFNPHYLGYIW